MPDGQPLEFSGVTKRFGAVTAVSGLTARVEPGRVTGFLGPNGAGKTTTLRILLGLVRATSGSATIGGRRYAELDRPLQTVGAVLEASSFHPGRTAAAHLTIYAQAAGIAKGRVDEVLALVGLMDAAGRKVGGFSLGMRQRLGLAYALLGDPGVLVLDEPANGLDPEGIRWMRGFLRQLAAEGRTVLVSSHLLAEVQQTVDALLIISAGRLVFQGSIEDLTDPDEHATVVDAPDRAALSAALGAAGLPFEVLRSGLTVRGQDPIAVGAAAAAAGVALSSLHRRGPALEEIFLDLVNGTRVHASATADAGAAADAGSAADADPVAEAAAEAEAPVQGADAAAVAEAPHPAADAEDDADTVPDSDSDADPVAEADVRAAAEAEAVADADADAEDEDDAGPVAEAGPSAAFAVASTGVIDVVPPADVHPEPSPDLDDQASPAEPHDDVSAEPQPPADADADADPWAPVDADPDVGAIAVVDEELSAPEPPDADDRPWENYAKTDADMEADAFFAAFDGDDAPPADAAPADEGEDHAAPADAAEDNAAPADAARADQTDADAARADEPPAADAGDAGPQNESDVAPGSSGGAGPEEPASLSPSVDDADAPDDEPRRDEGDER